MGLGNWIPGSSLAGSSAVMLGKAAMAGKESVLWPRMNHHHHQH